ncbi:hypothetical protein R6Q57_007769 [Mikania cordata]
MKWFGRFTNEESNPIILDNEEVDNESNDKDNSDTHKPIKEFLKPNKERKRKLKLKAKKVDKLKEAGSKRKIETSQQAEKVKVNKLKGNIEKSEENQSPYFEYTGQKIFMRCSPANLINFLEKLNEDQKKAVKEIVTHNTDCLWLLALKELQSTN